jgi:hypothetical protein
MNTLYRRQSSTDPPTVVSRTADSCQPISRLLAAVYQIEAYLRNISIFAVLKEL